ncbi:MAG: CopD family protein [Gemmatimonadaceae bacterium]|nr:CopD family protein [Gemmatimonadaceae bacterium]
MEWIFARWVSFVATVLMTGVCAVGFAMLPRAVVDLDARIAATRDVARVGVIACLAMIPASLLRLGDQILALQSPGDPVFAGAVPLLSSTTWGTGFLWQCAAIATALVGVWLVGRIPRSNWPWFIAAVGALGLCATPSMQGHAIGNEFNTAIAVTADVTHVFGAGLWLGGIGVIGWLGVAIPNADGVVLPQRAALADARLRLLVPLVPPVALSGAALLLTSGVVSSVLQLRDVSDLWGSEWGRHVLLKAILVLAIMGLGALNWRRLGPRLATTTGVPALRRSLLIELGLAAIVLVITSLLVVTPLPGGIGLPRTAHDAASCGETIGSGPGISDCGTAASRSAPFRCPLPRHQCVHCSPC